MREIQEAIAEKRRQIDELSNDIKALEKAAQIIERSARRVEKPESQSAMAAAILEEIGKPMHVASIGEQIKRKFQRAIKTNNLGVMLFRFARRGSLFYKVEGKPNTYGLLKWHSVTQRADEIREAINKDRALKAAS